MSIERFTQAAMAMTMLALLTLGAFQRHRIRQQQETIAALRSLQPDTLRWEDREPEPTVKDSVTVRVETRWLPARHDTAWLAVTDTVRDTFLVYVPITQKHYQSDEYDAWVSGYEPKLDSLRIHMPNTLPPTIIRKRRNGWSLTIGPQLGISTTREPYVGVGITAGFSFGLSK